MTVAQIRRDQIRRLLDGFTVQLPTSVGLLDIEPVASKPWVPLRRYPAVPEHVSAQHYIVGTPAPDEMWYGGGAIGGDDYEVMVYHLPDGVTHLSVKRMDRAPVRDWRHLQQIKNEILGPEREAVELFPRESRLADNANQYHLFACPENCDWPIGWPTGMVLIRADEVQAFNTAGHSGRQEPMQEGLTVGMKLDGARPDELDEAVGRFLR